jgi:predicted MFS family arabinose efflux permease
MARAATHHTVPGALSRDHSILAALAQTLLMFGFTTLPTPLYGDYAREFHFSTLTLTLIYATYVAGTLSMLFLLGRLSDQIGRKPVALTAIALAIGAGLLFITATSAAGLFAARLATGVAAGLSSGTLVAWLKELHARDQDKTASLRTVAINVLGLAVGPLLCGTLAQFAPLPHVTPYLVYIALLAMLALGIARAQDTVEQPRQLSQVNLKVRVGVPRGVRAAFMAPGIANLVLYSMVGFYSALTPGLIAKTLHITDHAASGALVSELFVVGAAIVYLTARLSSRAVMLWGFVLMLPALGLLLAAEIFASLPALVAGTAMGGAALGMGYRGAIEVGNQIAPPDKRAELISMLFVCGNLGLSLPVIGVGVLGMTTNPRLADMIFAGITALLSLAGLGFGLFAGNDRKSPKGHQ